MLFNIEVTDIAKLTGLQRALAQYNSLNEPKTEAAFVQWLVDGQLSEYARALVVAQMDPFTWLKTRFTSEERAAIRAAALTNGEVADLCAMTDKADIIHFSDPLTIGGIAKLEQVGLLAPGRGAEILAL